MSFDIYGDRLARGHCEVHPHVHQEYPCDLCLLQHSPKQRAPAGPMCGICGEHEACADSCGVAVCSEACDHEARRRQDESEAFRACIAELEASNAALREAAEGALHALESSRVFVTSRERIHKPDGESWYDERVAKLRAALKEEK